jgi:predicted transcriptional regulator
MSVDPRARLHWIRNVRRGLLARSSIVRRLERQEWNSVQDIAYDVNLAAATVLYHLHHMDREGVVEREAQGRKWGMSTRHQASLSDYLQPDKLGKKKESGKAKKRQTQLASQSTRRDRRR